MAKVIANKKVNATIQLDEAELGAVYAVLMRVAGSHQGPRKHIHHLLRELEDVLGERFLASLPEVHLVDEKQSYVYLKDYP